MEARLDKIENSEAYIEVEVGAEQLEEGLHKAYLKVVKQISIPGFRKGGKIPRELLEARFGPEILYQDAVEYLVPQAYEEALKQLDIQPIAHPEFDIDEIKSGEVFKFKARIPVKPDVVLGDIEGLEVTLPAMSISDLDVEAKLEEMRSRYAQLVEKTDEPAALGDTVYHDFEGFIDGVPFPGGKGEDYALELGSDTFIPGYEEQVVGAQTGAEQDVVVHFPADYHAEDLAGKEAVFKIKVNKIETKKMRDLDDEFVQEVSEFETVDELREDIRKNLEVQASDRRKNMMQQQILDQAVEKCEIIVAPAVIDQQVDGTLRQLEYRMAAQGMDMKNYMQLTGSSEETLRMSIRPDAERKVKCDFMLEKLIEEKGFEVSDEEIEKHIEEVAKNTDLTVDQTRERLASMMDGIVEQIKVDKALDYLVEKAVIKEEPSASSGEEQE